MTVQARATRANLMLDARAGHITPDELARAYAATKEHPMTLSPRVGDIVRTRDGHLHRVTRIIRDAWDAELDVACLQRCGDHVETAATLGRVVVVEEHPGGPR